MLPSLYATGFKAISQFDDDEDEDEKPSKKSPFGSSFRTFDGTDYSNIATIDVKKSIFGLCTDSSDCYLAVIEVFISQLIFKMCVTWIFA